MSASAIRRAAINNISVSPKTKMRYVPFWQAKGLQKRNLVGLYSENGKQEAQLSQRDRATRYTSSNLVNCCTIVRNIRFEKACNRKLTLTVTRFIFVYELLHACVVL